MPQPPAGADRFESLAQWADTIVVADTSATAQLEGLGAVLARYRDKLLVIDHHATTEDLGAVQFVDVSAAAAGVLACEIIEALGWPLETAAAEAMLVAITSDTGWLHFANTDARCLLAVARLVESCAGASPGQALHEALPVRSAGTAQAHDDHAPKPGAALRGPYGDDDDPPARL